MWKFSCSKMEYGNHQFSDYWSKGKIILRSNHIIVSVLVLISLEIASHASFLLFHSFKVNTNYNIGIFFFNIFYLKRSWSFPYFRIKTWDQLTSYANIMLCSACALIKFSTGLSSKNFVLAFMTKINRQCKDELRMFISFLSNL